MPSTLEFASTKKIPIKKDCGVVDMPSLEEILADNQLNKCLIVSAYTDVDWIESLLKVLNEKTSKKTLVQFYLDRGASKYRLVKDRLDTLAIRIKNLFSKNSGIYLVSCDGLFHSKMIYSESLTNIKVVVGSINFTKRAFDDNEEVALVENYCKPKIERPRHRRKRKKKRAYRPAIITPMLQYIKNLASSSVQIPHEFDSNYRTLRNRFLDGYLFKRTNEVDPFVFQLNFPKEFLKKLSTKNDDSEKNEDRLNHYLKDLKENTISIKKLLGEDERDESGLTKQERAKLKSYSLESSYGFWVPREYYNMVVKSCAKSTENKKAKLEESINSLNQIEKIKNGFETFKNAIIEKLKSKDKKFLEPSDNKIICRLQTSWQKWLKKLMEKFCISYGNVKYSESQRIACENLKKKLSSNLYGYKMPNLWDDADAAEEFESSILNSIEYLLHRVGNKTTLISDLIGDKICVTEDDIIKILVNHEFMLPLEKKKSRKCSLF